jgi:hypothetical protein
MNSNSSFHVIFQSSHAKAKGILPNHRTARVTSCKITVASLTIGVKHHHPEINYSEDCS